MSVARYKGALCHMGSGRLKEMLRLLLFGVLVALGLGAAALEPSAFYVVSVAFSDYGPSFYYRVIDVSPSGPDSVVRYIRIAPVGVWCPKQIWRPSQSLVGSRACLRQQVSRSPLNAEQIPSRSVFPSNRRSI